MAKPRACVVPCCQGEKFELVHKFPADRERAELWKSILNVPELEPLDVDVIRGRYFVCSRHFLDSDYKNKLSRSLNITANPSLNLEGLYDEEGLNRVIPPMGRVSQSAATAVVWSKEQQQDTTAASASRRVVTVSLEVQNDSFEEPNETSEVQLIYDPLMMDEQVEPADHHPSRKPIEEVKLDRPLAGDRKRTMPMNSMAGSTPAKIYKFKKNSGTLVAIETQGKNESNGQNQLKQLQLQPQQAPSDPVILRKVKFVPPQKKLVKVCPIVEKKELLVLNSVATQTDTFNEVKKEESSSEKKVVEVEEAPEMKQDVEEGEGSKMTRVLALLECTPENLERLKSKMNGGAVLFDEKLFQEVTDGKDEEEAMTTPSGVDESQFLTVQRSPDDEPIRVSYFWLRDHCRCNECYNHTTFQRSLSILDIPEDVRPASYEIRDGALNVIWQDDHASSYDLDFIFSAQFDVYKESLRQEHSQPVLWDRELISLCPEYCRVTLNELLCDDDVVKRLVASLVTHGVAFIEKVPANQQSTEMAVRRIFPIHKTLFGEMWTFSDSMDHSDTAYTKNFLGPHTDNTYFNDASGLQVLHCIQFNGSGGETILIDGFKAAEQLKLKSPEVFERLCQYPLAAEYLEEGKHHTCTAPVIKRNMITDEVEQLRFNPYDRAIMKTIPQEKVPEFYRDYRQLAAEINDETMAWQFRLTPGTVMIFDNWRVLHGRMAYTGKRVMTGCYVSRTDYQSVARTMGIIS